METKTKLLIVETNEDIKEQMTKHFKLNPNFELSAVLSDGEAAYDHIVKFSPDIVLFDIVLPGLDGFELLEKVSLLTKKPQMVVLSSLNTEGFAGKALNLGASYYMIKPVKLDIIEKRLKDVSSSSFTNVVTVMKPKVRVMDEKLSNIFITVGIPAHIKGYQFLREAIKMAIDCPEVINSITKELYPSIAGRFETSPSKVERAIRHAIEVAWNRGKIENINSLFGIKVYNSNEKPTNSEFIALVADKMLIEGFGR